MESAVGMPEGVYIPKLEDSDTVVRPAEEVEVDEVSGLYAYLPTKGSPRLDLVYTRLTSSNERWLIVDDNRRGGRGGRGGYNGGGDRDRPPPPESGSNRMRKMIIKFAEEEVSFDPNRYQRWIESMG